MLLLEQPKYFAVKCNNEHNVWFGLGGVCEFAKETGFISHAWENVLAESPTSSTYQFYVLDKNTKHFSNNLWAVDEDMVALTW